MDPTLSLRRRRPSPAPVLATAAALALALPVTAAAQGISGKVVEATTGAPLAGAAIVVTAGPRSERGEAVTDDEGRFALELPRADGWILAVSRLGYHTFVSDPIPVRAAEWLTVEISLAEAAIALEPLVVTGRRGVGSPALQAFYDRWDRAGRSGMGRFIVRDDIERAAALRPTDLLRTMAGVRVVRGRPGRGEGVRMSGGCIPAIYIDGMQINRLQRYDSVDDFVNVMDIEGIEVYRGPASQVGHYHDPGGCGLLLVWTRSGVYDPDSRFSWRPILGALGAIAAFFLFFN